MTFVSLFSTYIQYKTVLPFSEEKYFKTMQKVNLNVKILKAKEGQLLVVQQVQRRLKLRIVEWST